ncbi:hypothetical protein O6H91_17G083500 [Diphasiastrum complanatum]|uniref:Uncharacterized protein n=1 Tax=Diphasiastrum complanatum TaxID=34168 RepID=A0ACC2B8W5_DIPCM|nr:hypothetical protein O6H91_17G083500 [Diphasiastrum complanatum]
MDGMLAKASGYLFSWRAKKEISSFGDDINNMSTSVEEGAKHFFNRLRGTMQTPLPDLLRSYDLPKGLFPKNATHYEFDETTSKLTVILPWTCEVGFRDTSILRYAPRVTGTLQKGKLIDIEGLKTKVLLWVKVTSISAGDSNDKLYFNVGMKKSRSKEAYEISRNGIQVDEF